MKLVLSKQRKIWWTVSSALILAGIVSMIVSFQQFGAPLRPSLDFTGGTRLLFERNCQQPAVCSKPIDIAQVRSILDKEGLGASNIQVLGTQQQAVSIRTKPLDVEKAHSRSKPS